MTPSRVIVTGASGFVGAALSDRLAREARFRPVALVRRPGSASSSTIETVVVPSLEESPDWSPILRGARYVIHAAARAHQVRESSSAPLAKYRAVNVDATERLARHAAAEGVQRFVFLSSVKVMGETTAGRPPLAESDVPSPTDPYGISKLEAEEALARVARETTMQVVVIRPPLVYGPGVRANFKTMMQWLRRGIPLPLGGIENLRSLVALDNLVDFVVHCLESPEAANETFLVSDGEDLSTPELLRRTAAALGTSARLLSVPPSLLGLAATLLGRRAQAERLCGSLQVDASKARDRLGWRPPITVDEGLAQTARHYLDEETS